MNFVDIVNEVCADCKTKEEAIKRLHDFGLIDVKGIKYLKIHQTFLQFLSQSSMMDAVYSTAAVCNISMKQVYIVREYWKKKKSRIEA